MSLQDSSIEELQKQKKKTEIGFWFFLLLLILVLVFYFIEQLSASTWRVLFSSFTAIILINALSLMRINKELKRRDDAEETKSNSDL